MSELPPDASSDDPGAVPLSDLPVHIAVIMDGNGRWGRKHGVGRLTGHQNGVRNVRSLVESCIELGVQYLTLFAFSSENWRRPKQEIRWLMSLLARALDDEVKTLDENDVRLRFIGDLTALPQNVQTLMRDATALTEANRRLHLTLAINYGGKWDITQACRLIAAKAAAGGIAPDDIDDAAFERHLCTASMPEPDLFVRTGGEQRISNFMLWSLAYTELYFTDTYWPDFDRTELDKALRSYASRVRRFGRTDEQVGAKVPA